MMNNCNFMGRLVRDPELRQTNNGTPVASFTLAVTRDGGKDKKTDFIDFTAWNVTAEFVCKYFAKGDLVGVTGRLQMREYDDKQGQKRRASEIVVDRIYFAQSKPRDVGESDRPAAHGEHVPMMQEIDDVDEELPF